MENKDPGYVYMLTNPSFKVDWVKIGKKRKTCRFAQCLPRAEVFQLQREDVVGDKIGKRKNETNYYRNYSRF